MLFTYDGPCLQCGALPVTADTCRDRSDLYSVVAPSDPAYFAMPHLTVPACLLHCPSQSTLPQEQDMRSLFGRLSAWARAVWADTADL